MACADYCVISYTPTLTALLDARRDHRRMLKVEAQVLLAAVSHPYTGVRLHSVSEEAEIITTIIPQHNLIALGTDINAPTERIATADRVREHLVGTTILHLACHGEQDMNNPLDSGFLMQDGKLTVSQLMALDLPSAFFAFLSACETAKGDANQPDQAIHLAATMLYADFKSVVGTMWSVARDRTTRGAVLIDVGFLKVDERCRWAACSRDHLQSTLRRRLGIS